MSKNLFAPFEHQDKFGIFTFSNKEYFKTHITRQKKLKGKHITMQQNQKMSSITQELLQSTILLLEHTHKLDVLNLQDIIKISSATSVMYYLTIED